VDGCIQYLTEQDVEVQFEHQRGVWAIEEDNRPKFLYEREDDARTSFGVLSKAQGSVGLRFYDEIWFVTTGDQFIFSAESADELLSFLRGMAASLLLRVATR
jgi:hypothetical protein